MISRRIRVWTRDRRDLRRLAQKFVRIRLVLVPVLAFSVACAYSAKQEKHLDLDVDKGGQVRTEEEPSTVAEFDPPAFPDQPLKDRLRKVEVKGGKKTWSEDWLKGKMGEDEHLDVDAKVGPSGFEWLLLAAGGVVLLVIGGYAAWRLKPPWLTAAWGAVKAVFARKGPAVAQGDSGGPGVGPGAERAS